MDSVWLNFGCSRISSRISTAKKPEVTSNIEMDTDREIMRNAGKLSFSIFSANVVEIVAGPSCTASAGPH